MASQADRVTRVAFVVPFAFETSLRFLAATTRLPSVQVGLISADPVDRFEPAVVARLAGHVQVSDALDADQLTQGARVLAKQLGGLDRLVGVLENLQVPLARAREALGLTGMTADIALNFRDKARMKDVLRAADVPCARHRLVHHPDEAHAFLQEIGFPVVVKPPDGAGAVSTFRLDSMEQLGPALERFPPRPDNPMLIEEFIVGIEHSYDSVWMAGKPVWHSISRYSPTPLEVLQHQWIQWCVLLPRHVDGPEFEPIRTAADKALAALQMDTGLSHMEWFFRTDGSVAISEVGARPPGAQFTSLLSWAHDVDMYRAWAGLVVQDEFEVPERRFAVGAAYLRGQGRGRVKAVHGLERAQAEIGDLAVEVRLPRPGQNASSSYEGEGWAILRHPETEVVEAGLRRLVEIVRVELG